MVHYKLGTPQFFDSEQILASRWRLVRQLPAGSTTWHPKNDNLEGVDTVYGGGSNYGIVDRSDWTWSVPFNAPRPAHVGQTSYSMPDEMFISNAAMTKWVYFPRNSILENQENGAETNDPVYASSVLSTPHMIKFRVHPGSTNDPLIFYKPLLNGIYRLQRSQFCI